MKKTIIYLTILVLVAACSFAGGYVGSLKANIKDQNIFDNENASKEEQNLAQDNEQISTKPQTTELSNNKTPSKSSKSSQKKPAVSSSSKKTTKEEPKIVTLDIYYRDGCSFCSRLLKFLNSLDSEIKSQMVIRKHDTTKEYDKFQATIEKYGNNPGYGVPYVVFNNEKSLAGYSNELETAYLEYINEYIN